MKQNLEIVDNVLVINNDPIYLDRQGSGSDIEYVIPETLSMYGHNATKIKQFKKLFSSELVQCIDESLKIDDLLQSIPTDFCDYSIVDIEKAFQHVSSDLKSKVVLRSDDYPNDDGFVSHYWILKSDVKQYPYFSAFSLLLWLEQQRYTKNSLLQQVLYRKDLAQNSLAKAEKEFTTLKASLEGCKDETFVATKLKAIKAKISKHKKELDEHIKAYEDAQLNIQELMNDLKELPVEAPEFKQATEKLLNFFNE